MIEAGPGRARLADVSSDTPQPLVSVLIPSRGRPRQLRSTIGALRDRAADPTRVQVLVAHDPDDRPTGVATACLDVLVVQVPHRFGRAGLRQYYDVLARCAVGEWLLLWTDTAPVGPRWDLLLGTQGPDIAQVAFVTDTVVRHAVRRAAYGTLTARA